MRATVLVIVVAMSVAAGPALAASRESRCLAMIAYAEAAVDGERAMAAVIRVVRNRIADADFPEDACAVALQSGQFQPVGERPALAAALRDPLGYSPFTVLGARGPAARRSLLAALRLAHAPAAGVDPSRGALYFVNPMLMDPARCPWFADLARTAVIGSHVFMRERRPGEAGLPPALDCDAVRLVAAEPATVPVAPRRAGRLEVIARDKLVRALARRRAEVESLYVRRTP